MGGGISNTFISLVNNGDYYLNLAKDLAEDEHKVKEALVAYEEAIVFFTKIKIPSLEQKKLLIEAYQGVGNIYSQQRLFNLELAIENYKKAKELCNPREDFAQILEIEKNLKELENLDESEKDEQVDNQTAPKLPKELLDEIRDVCRKEIEHEIEHFLKEVKEKTLKANSLTPEPLLISYVPEKNKDLAILVAIHDLKMYLSQVGINVVLDPLTTADNLEEKLKNYDRVMIFCTPLYAKAVTNEPRIKKVLESFVETAQSKKGKLYTTLYTLLCDGGFADTALKVVDSHYLVRHYQKVVNPNGITPPIDVIESMRIFIDIFAHFSGNQGLGILPDLLSLTVLSDVANQKKHEETYENYKSMFNQFEQKVQRINFDYKLKINLLSIAENNPLKSYFNSELPALSKISTYINKLLNNSHVKTELLFCPTVADTILVGLALEKTLIKQQKVRVLSINCANYRGKAAHDCVELFLKKLKFTTNEINELKQANNILIIFKNYEQLGAYDNLYVRNQLGKWNNVKVLVTCGSDFFQHRSFNNCFLSDPSNPDLTSLSYDYIEHFAPIEAQKERVYMGKTKKIETEDNLDFFGIKRRAQQKELCDFLRKLNAIFTDKNFLQKDRHVFISYAWEDAKTEEGKALARQQYYLRCIANDLTTLGFPTWLDVERMTGDINSQMVININNSRYVLLIGTKRYKERANQETNVKKEYDTILARGKDQKLTIFPINFTSQDEKDIFPETLLSHDNYINKLDFSSIDNGENYIKILTCIADFDGLIPRLLDLKSSTKTHVLSEYRKCLDDFYKRLSLLPAKHLLTDKGQYDVQAYDIDNRLKAYIKPYGLKKVTDELKERFDLQDDFNKFLNHSVKTYVVLGRAGAGKSLFALSTFKDKLQDWHNYRKYNSSSPPTWLPIYVPLKNYDFTNKDSQQISKYIEDILKQDYQLDQQDVDSLKEGLEVKQGLLFILDGYDELGKGIYPNFAEILANWQYAKFVVAGRPEHFDSTSQHAAAFALLKKDSEERDYQSFNLSYISQFSIQDIKDYIEEYRKVNPDDNLQKDTYNTLNSIPGLMGLLDNPFVLHLVLQSIKQLLKNRQQDTTVSRFDVYNAFAEYWFTKEASRRNITNERCQEFAEALACRLFQEKTISVTPAKIKLWQEFFTNPKKFTERECCPLRRSGHEYSFIHKSIYEYFIAIRLWKELTNKQQKIHAKMSWNYQLLTEEIAVIEFIREMYKAEKIRNPQNLEFIKNRLFEMINMSKSNKSWTITAANAITMLPLLEGRDCLVGQDFSKVKISGATLENVNLNKAIFKDAILQNVNLRCANLDETNFTKADLTGTFFGEYAPLTGHTASITSIATLNNKQIATSSFDATVKIWDLDSGKQLETLTNHTDAIFCMTTYKGMIITGSSDNTCRIWHKPLLNFKEQFCLKDHTDAIHSLTVTPNSIYLATGSYDHTCRVWNINTGLPIACLEEHTDTVNNLLFTYDNKFLITTSYDRTCRLWDVSQLPNQKKSASILNHQTMIHCLALIIDNNYLVTGDDNGYYHIWQISSSNFIELHKLKAHSKQVSTLLITPDQKNIITASHDNTYHLTELKNSDSTTHITAHTTEITTAHITSESKRLITTSHSGEIKIWDMDTQKQLASFNGHQDSIYASAITPDNKKVITGSSDTTCRIWDTSVSDKVSLSRDTFNHNPLSTTNIIITNTKLSDSNKRLLLSKSAKLLYTHNSPINYKDYYKNTLSDFLKLVGFGEQEKAEEMLTKNPHLALQKGTLTDCTSRSYYGISALQYAIWALDYHMWSMILKQLENANLKHIIRAQLEEIQNIATLNEKGWIIKQNINNRWPSLSWHPLILAYNKYLNKGYNSEVWQKQVGGAQLLLPAHIINEYSHPNRPNGFEGCTWGGNDEGILPRTGVIDWKNVNNGEYILGKDVAWVRGDWGARWASAEGMRFRGDEIDLRAMDELMKARVEHARMLISSELTISSSTPKHVMRS